MSKPVITEVQIIDTVNGGACTRSVSTAIGSVAVIRSSYRNYWALAHIPSGFMLPLDGWGHFATARKHDALLLATWWDEQLPITGEFHVSPITTPEQGRIINDALKAYTALHNITAVQS